jgi:hypothetical protein
MESWRIEMAASTAIEHYRAAFHCSRENGYTFGSSQLMLASFSAELAMKALIYQSGSNVKGHKFKLILSQLPTTYVTEIETELKAEWDDYDSFMDDADNAFVEWRYIFEKEGPKTVNHNFVMRLAEICCNIVKREFNIEERVVQHGLTTIGVLPSVKS